MDEGYINLRSERLNGRSNHIRYPKGLDYQTAQFRVNRMVDIDPKCDLIAVFLADQNTCLC